jgi:hypothetical protein
MLEKLDKKVTVLHMYMYMYILKQKTLLLRLEI